MCPLPLRRPARQVGACTLLLALLLVPLAVLARDCAPEPAAEVEAAVQATRLGQGLLWRIEAPDGTTEPSHLYGTMHVDFPQVTRLAPPVALAFARARALVVEVVLDDEAQASYRARMRLPAEAPGLVATLGEPLASEYLRLAAAAGASRELADRLTPWAAANLVARPPPRAGGVTLDEALQHRALASGRPVQALETMDSLLATLAAIAPEDHLALLVDAVCRAGELPRELAIDVERYLEGDLDTLMARAREPIARDPAFARHWARLVDDRNAAFMDALAPMLAQGGHFIAAGALHLPGELGLLARIEAAGYRIERVFGGRDGPAPGALPLQPATSASRADGLAHSRGGSRRQGFW